MGPRLTLGRVGIMKVRVINCKLCPYQGVGFEVDTIALSNNHSIVVDKNAIFNF